MGGNQTQHQLQLAAKLSQSELSRPDDRYGIGKLRFRRRRKNKVEEAPELTAAELERAERQRRLMTTDNAEAEVPESGEQA